MSAPPGRLRRSWGRTALSTPSLQPLAELRKRIQNQRRMVHKTRRSTTQWETHRNNSSGSEGQLHLKICIVLFISASSSAKICKMLRQTMPLHHLDAVLTCPFIRHTCWVCFCVFTDRLDSFHPCNSTRSDFSAAPVTSYTLALKSPRLRRQGFQSGVLGPPTGQWLASRWT